MSKVFEPYPHKSTRELRASLFLFRLLARPFLVRIGLFLVRFLLQVRFPIAPFVKFTGYEQFCAGKDVLSCTRATSRLMAFRVFSVLDYANEHANTSADYEHNAHVVIETIREAKHNPAYPFAVVKPSAIGSFKLFEKKTQNKPLSAVEQKDWNMIKQRLDQLAFEAQEAGIVLMIDAEESWIQEGVDAVVLPLMRQFNKKQVVIAITIQLYLNGNDQVYQSLLKDANTHAYYLGAKLVRGAYMEIERNRAVLLNIDAPVCNTKEETDTQYRAALHAAMKALDQHLCIVATHNQLDINWVVAYCKNNKLSLASKNLWFSQLFGMRDYVSFSLAAQGANIFKYVPFGPLRQAIPYLIRRALENSAMKTQTLEECYQIKAALKRRKFSV